eukprot:scpid39651/ scgid25940/ 
MSRLQDSWDDVVNATDDEKHGKLVSFLNTLIGNGQLWTTLRDANSVADFLANLLLENSAEFHHDHGGPEADFGPHCVQYFCTSGYLLLQALSLLSCEGVVCHQQLASTLMEQFSVCIDLLLKEDDGLKSNTSSLCGDLPTVDEWCTLTGKCCTHLLHKCELDDGGHDDIGPWQSSALQVSTLLLLCVQGICLENVNRHLPQWSKTATHQLDGLCQMLQHLTAAISEPCFKLQLVNERVCHLGGILIRVLLCVFYGLSQHAAACVPLVQETRLVPELLSLATALVDRFDSLAIPPLIGMAADVIHVVLLILSPNTPLPLLIPLVCQLIKSDGLSVVQQLITIDVEKPCAILCSRKSHVHQVIPSAMKSLLETATCLQLPSLGFPVLGSTSCNPINVSSALLLSAVDSGICLSSKLTQAFLLFLAQCTCPRVLYALVPLLERLSPCLCISSDVWLSNLLIVYRNCQYSAALGEQVLQYMLAIIRKLPVCHSIIHVDGSEGPGCVGGYAAEQSAGWPVSLKAYLDMILTSSLDIALALVQHLGKFAECAGSARYKLCWQVAVPLLEAVSKADTGDLDSLSSSSLSLLQSSLLLCTKILVTASDQEQFLERFPWRLMFEKWLGHPLLQQFSLPLLGVILSISVEQVFSHSSDDDCVSKLAVFHPSHRHVLSWMVDIVMWCPATASSGISSSGGGGGSSSYHNSSVHHQPAC